MEIREFAKQVLLSDDLAEKLERPKSALTDDSPGEPVRIDRPNRPSDLQFAARRTAPAMPKGPALRDTQKRAVAHHIMANHELQALEVMAMVLLAFPNAPADFRLGMARIMFDEQRHTRLHANRAAELGAHFGSLPVNSYIWQKACDYTSVLEYVAGLPLVFEGANLDHTIEFEQYFLQHNDRRGAEIMRAIHLDEIEHVRFGINWLRRMKMPDESDFATWKNALKWPIRPKHARGDHFQRQARLDAGLTTNFIEELLNWDDTAPPHDDQR